MCAFAPTLQLRLPTDATAGPASDCALHACIRTMLAGLGSGRHGGRRLQEADQGFPVYMPPPSSNSNVARGQEIIGAPAVQLPPPAGLHCAAVPACSGGGLVKGG